MQAVQQYSEALEADPQLTAARNNRALAHLKLQHFDAAEADADAVLQAQPENVKALLRRGNARYSSSHLKDSFCLCGYQAALLRQLGC